MSLTFRFDIPDVNGEALGKVSALTPGGERLVHADRGDFYSSVTRGRFCRAVADKAIPPPARNDGEADDAFAARAAVADQARVAAADEADRQIMAHLRDRELQRAKAEADAALADDGGGADDDAAEPRGPAYFEDEFGGISRRYYTPQGDEAVVPLTNFTARIVQDVRRDDGVEAEHAFAVEATVRGRPPVTFTVTAKAFNALGWATEHLGATAIVYAGQSVRDHARVAVQSLSGAPPRRTVYTHLGWREVEPGVWAYLSAGGAIGKGGVVDGVEVDLAGPLANFRLPAPPEGEELRTAVRASLRLLALSRPPVVCPLLAAVWRGVLGGCDSSLHLAGASGVFKSELAALVQQHFGPAMTARNLPASWVSTDNALEATCSAAKDAVLVIDEFLPRGTASDVQALHRKADRILRGVGNHAGRGRMAADGRLRPHRPPRCVVLSTGEDSPSGQSLKARILILELAKGDVDPAALAACQADAAAGLYAQATAAFVRWLAPRYADLRASMPAELAALRLKAATRQTSHARTPDIVANLGYGMRLFLRYAADCGAVSGDDAKRMAAMAWAAIADAADGQAAHQLADEPAARFVQLLRAAVASGGAHLADAGGDAPAAPEAWGWRRREVGTGAYQRDEWDARGDRVGWVTTDGVVCLEPDASYKAAQAVAGNNGLAVSAATLRKRMAEKGKIVVDEGRGELVLRRTLQGQVRRVVVLKPGVLDPAEAADDAQDDDDDDNNRGSGRARPVY